MDKVTVFIERGDDGTYGAFVEQDMPYGIIGEGNTVAETIEDFNIGYEEMRAHYLAENREFPEFEFEYSMPAETLRTSMYDVLTDVSWAHISRDYFGKSSSWFYHKMDGRDGNGNPTDFSAEEREVIKGALVDLSEKIRKAADKL